MNKTKISGISCLSFLLVFMISGCDFTEPDIVVYEQKKETISFIEGSEEKKSEDTETVSSERIDEYTDEQLLEIAREQYRTACEMTEKYLSGKVYMFDRTKSIDRGGETAYLVNDSMISSIDDVMKEWLSVFDTEYIELYNDMFSHYFPEGDNVWVIPCEYDLNEKYIDTVISQIVSRNENEVKFKVVSRYQTSDGSQKIIELPFSIIYGANVFKVGTFVMPY